MDNILMQSTESESTIKIVKTIYILNFVTIIFPICSLLGVILAYVFHDDARGYLKSHFRFLIRSFWISLLYYAIAGLLCLVLVGFVLLVLVTIWWIVRNAKGLKDVLQAREVANPATWWI